MVLVVSAGVVSAAVIVGLAVFLHWRHNARELFAYDGITGYSDGQVGRTFYVDAVVQPRHGTSGHEVLDLRRLTARVTANSADATVTLLICPRRPGGDGGLGSATSTRPFCSSARPFKPGTLDLGEPVTQVIYAITARRPGVVRIEGCDVSYRVGSRSGTQHVGSGFVEDVHTATP